MINWTTIKSALITGVLMGLFVIITEMISAKSVYGLAWSTLINDGIIAFLTIIASLLRSLLTTPSGNFVGLVKVTEPTEIAGKGRVSKIKK